MLPVLMCPLWTKSPQQDFAGLSAQERGSIPLSLQKHLAEKGSIVLNSRKQAFLEQTFRSAGAGPLLWNGKDDGRQRGRERVCAARLPSAISLPLCRLCLFAQVSLQCLKSVPSHQDIFVARSWWVAIQEMGYLPPSASLCQHPTN